ncbi:centromere protein X, partial [Lecanoromycetidae sp. Uapishka_2]
MAPANSKPAPKRKAPAFKPPRPAASKNSKPKSAPRRKSAPTKRTSYIDTQASASDHDEDDDDDDDDIPSDTQLPDASEESDDLQLSQPTNTQDPPPTIPPALLTKLLHHHFKDDNIRIGKEAKGVVGKYMETFVREAIARAAFERSEAQANGGGGVGSDILEVEDLEKLAPQLILDF